jgi:glyoxylase-like metal-dependent hydrolase (beta-lactamase superfamily II)
LTWRIGAASVRRVTEVDTWRFAPADLFATWTDADTVVAADRYPGAIDRTSGELVLSIHTYVVDIGGRRILVDAGNGDHKERPALLPHHMLTAGYPDRLRAAGIEPETVDVVTATHLHPDHCGGYTVLVDGVWKAAFPNAEYVLHEADLDWLRQLDQEAAEGTVAGDIARTYRDSVLPIMDAARTVAGATVVAEHDGTVVRLEPAPGHSPGHTVVRIDAPEGGGVVLVGDLIHHPLQLDRSTLVNNGDADAESAACSRHDVLAEAASNDRRILTAHFPVGGPERISETNGQLTWLRGRSSDLN